MVHLNLPKEIKSILNSIVKFINFKGCANEYEVIKTVARLTPTVVR